MDDLLKKIEQIPDKSESAINEALKSRSGKTALEQIDKGTPVSKGQLRRGHKHARGADAYKVIYGNLSFKIRPKAKYEYLKYPDLGIGTSAKKSAQEFLNQGLNRSVPKIHQQLLDAVEKIIMK